MLSNIVRAIDLFGYYPAFTYQGGAYKTFFGGLVSILLVLLIVAILFFMVQDWWLMNNGVIVYYKTSMRYNNDHLLKLKQMPIMFMFEPMYNPPRYNFTFEELQKIFTIKVMKVEDNEHLIPIESGLIRCDHVKEDDYGPNLLNIMKTFVSDSRNNFPLENLVCFNKTVLEESLRYLNNSLADMRNRENFQGYNVFLKVFPNEAHEDHSQLVALTTSVLYFNDPIMFTENIKEIGRLDPVDLFLGENIFSINELNIDIIPPYVKDQYQFYNKNTFSLRTLLHDLIDNSDRFSSKKNSIQRISSTSSKEYSWIKGTEYCMLNMRFGLDPDLETVELKHQKFIDLIAKFGGTIKVLSYLIKFLRKFLYKNCFFLSIGRELEQNNMEHNILNDKTLDNTLKKEIQNSFHKHYSYSSDLIDVKRDKKDGKEKGNSELHINSFGEGEAKDSPNYSGDDGPSEIGEGKSKNELLLKQSKDDYKPKKIRDSADSLTSNFSEIPLKKKNSCPCLSSLCCKSKEKNSDQLKEISKYYKTLVAQMFDIKYLMSTLYRLEKQFDNYGESGYITLEEKRKSLLKRKDDEKALYVKGNIPIGTLIFNNDP